MMIAQLVPTQGTVTGHLLTVIIQAGHKKRTLIGHLKLTDEERECTYPIMESFHCGFLKLPATYATSDTESR